LIEPPERSSALGRAFSWPVFRASRACWIAFALALLATGCRGPSNHRNWSPNQAVLSTADINGRYVTIHNIRNTAYRTADDYDVRHYDKTFDLEKLNLVNFIMAPLPEVPGAAHTFMSFGFEGGDHVAISVEIRRQQGEEFSAARSVTQPYEIMYVVGDERDLIELRTIHWLEDVYLYEGNASPPEMRALFVDMLKRANKLSQHPEYYNLVTNNCTTNIVRHINNVSPGRIPYTRQVPFTALADRMAYDLKLIKSEGTFERTRELARVNELAYIHRDQPDFSARIRRMDTPAIAQRDSWTQELRR
jgi:hypothetical protein